MPAISVSISNDNYLYIMKLAKEKYNGNISLAIASLIEKERKGEK